MYSMVKKPTIAETIRLNMLRWFGQLQRMEEHKILPPLRQSIIYESVKKAQR
jgi:hypothetical protein